MEGSLGVRKGAWSKEEDDLLRACVERYGEGKWHLVPMRAGLSRCRKSCRLRWLYYLRPDIKRGQFTEDEVDLMIRLHRLLGNRWSLIAGRLPRRTANDVKNYWSTNVRKKLSPSLIPKEDTNNIIAKPKGITAVTPLRPDEVIKPKPRTFSTMITSPWLRTGFLIGPYHQQDHHDDENNGAKGLTVDACAASPSGCNKGWRGDEWWGTVLEDKGGNSENDLCYFGDDQQDGKPLTDPASWNEGLATEADGELLIEGQSWSDLLLDTDLWDFVYQV